MIRYEVSILFDGDLCLGEIYGLGSVDILLKVLISGEVIGILGW